MADHAALALTQEQEKAAELQRAIDKTARLKARKKRVAGAGAAKMLQDDGKGGGMAGKKASTPSAIIDRAKKRLLAVQDSEGGSSSEYTKVSPLAGEAGSVVNGILGGALGTALSETELSELRSMIPGNRSRSRIGSREKGKRPPTPHDSELARLKALNREAQLEALAMTLE